VNNFRPIILHITSLDSLFVIAHVVAGILACQRISFVLNKFMKKTLIPMRVVFSCLDDRIASGYGAVCHILYVLIYFLLNFS